MISPFVFPSYRVSSASDINIFTQKNSLRAKKKLAPDALKYSRLEGSTICPSWVLCVCFFHCFLCILRKGRYAGWSSSFQDGRRAIAPERRSLNSSSNLDRSFKSTTLKLNHEASFSATAKASATPESTFLHLFLFQYQIKRKSLTNKEKLTKFTNFGVEKADRNGIV